MAEILGQKRPVLYHMQPLAPGRKCLLTVVTGIQRQPFLYDSFITGRYQPLIACQFCIQADIFFSAMVMSFKSIPAQIDGRFPVNVQKLFQPTAVVIVPMGKDGDIHTRQIDAEHPGIVRKQLRLSHIKQYFPAAGLYIEGQTVLRPEIFIQRTIFYQSSDLHLLYPPVVTVKST